jgi:hypothetical protein
MSFTLTRHCVVFYLSNDKSAALTTSNPAGHRKRGVSPTPKSRRWGWLSDGLSQYEATTK